MYNFGNVFVRHSNFGSANSHLVSNINAIKIKANMITGESIVLNQGIDVDNATIRNGLKVEGDLNIDGLINGQLKLNLTDFLGFPFDTANTTDISGLGITSAKWAGGVLAPNGKIYSIPRNSESVLIIDSNTNTINTTDISGLGLGGDKWFGGVLASNDKIYCIPNTIDNVLIIDSNTNTINTTDISGLGLGSSKWRGGVLAPNGKIYCIPSNSDSVLIINPVNNSFNITDISGLPGNPLSAGNQLRWMGGVLASNGKIYTIPFNNNNILVINPEDNSYNIIDITRIMGTGSGDRYTKYIGGVLAPNGKIYCVPFNRPNVLIIDPNSSVIDISGLYDIDITLATYTNSSRRLDLSGANLIGNIIVGDNIILTTNLGIFIAYVQTVNNDNLILGIELGTGITEITKLEQTRIFNITKITGLTTSAGKWLGGVLAPNGKIYCISQNSDNILIIDPLTDTANTTTISGLGSGGSKWIGGVLASNGIIYGIPGNSDSVLQIKTGLPTLPLWMLQAYFNKF